MTSILRDTFDVVQARFAHPTEGTLVPFYDDPTGWAETMIRWPPGESLTDYQREIMKALPTEGRVSVRGPHGLGKSTAAALLVLWFANTREAAGRDWKIPTTASAWRQLTQYLWPEIHKWAGRIRWEVLDRQAYREPAELQVTALKLRHGAAFAVASNQPALIEGAHADSILYVFDEAKAIPSGTFEAAEGAFSGAGAIRPDGSPAPTEALALAFSTPGEPNGTFYDIQRHAPGTEDWWTRHVTLEETIAAGRVSAGWATQRGLQWGVGSAAYANRVLGEFHSADEDGVIPLSWLELAQERWRDWADAGRLLDPKAMIAVGIDVARSGSDKTTFARRYGWLIPEVEYHALDDTMTTANLAAAILNSNRETCALVDVIGIGAGVFDRLREQGYRTEAFNASEGTLRTDASGEFGFTNVRSAAWWNLRELLDPLTGVEIALPDDDVLVGDLTSPKWRVMAGGRIQVESKDDIRKRIGRSTDAGDAVVQACWPFVEPASMFTAAPETVASGAAAFASFPARVGRAY